MKACTTCKELKILTDFCKDAKANDGLNYVCKSCNEEYKAAYNKTREGLAANIYGSQRSSSKARCHDIPNYSNSELKEWLFSQSNFEVLFQNWIDSDYDAMLSPSVDRLDDYKPYTFDNIRLITWKANKDKGHADRKNGVNNKMSKAVVQKTKSGKFVAEHYSTHQASRTTGIHQGNISQCCTGKRSFAGNYVWNHA